MTGQQQVWYRYSVSMNFPVLASRCPAFLKVFRAYELPSYLAVDGHF